VAGGAKVEVYLILSDSKLFFLEHSFGNISLQFCTIPPSVEAWDVR